ADAQAVLRADPNDPNQLDTSGLELNPPHHPDGIACSSGAEAPEWAASFFYPPPYDKTPVPTPNGGRNSGQPTFTPTSVVAATATRTPTPTRGLPNSVTP